MRGIALAAAIALSSAPAGAEEKVAIERLGATFEFTLPTGWSTVQADDAVTFVTPVLTSGQVIQVVFMVKRREGKGSALDGLRELADSMKRQTTGLSFDLPSDTTFMGAPGAAATWRRAEAGFAFAGQVIVAKDADFGYVVLYNGLSSDVIDGDFKRGIQQLLSGARRAQKAAAVEEVKPRAAAPRRELRDPAWGVEVKGLGEGWRIGVEPAGYVLFSARPQATVVLLRLTEAEADKLVRQARTVTGAFGGMPAVVSEGLSPEGARQKTWLIRSAGRILAISFSSVTWGEAEPLVAQVEKAVRLFEPVLEETAGGGVAMELPHGLTLRLPRPWTLAGVGPEHASFHGPEGTTVKVRVLRLEANEEDPFQDERYTNRRTCALYDLTFDERDVAVPGASRAKRFRCQGKGRAALMVLLEGQRAGAPIYVSVVAYYDKKAGRTPDAVVADFLSHLGMPR